LEGKKNNSGIDELGMGKRKIKAHHAHHKTF
jgi:hypothetical protein